MAITLIKEDGSIVTNANTYVTLAEADTFFEGEIETTEWDAASDATKNIALVNAQRTLQNQYRWKGSPAVPDTQPLRWPRANISVDYSRLSSSEIPQAIQDAQCLLAFELLQSLAFEAAAGSANDIGKIGLGGGALEIEYQTTSDSGNVQRTVITSRIRTLLREYGYSMNGGSMVPARRG